MWNTRFKPRIPFVNPRQNEKSSPEKGAQIKDPEN